MWCKCGINDDGGDCSGDSGVGGDSSGDGAGVDGVGEITVKLMVLVVVVLEVLLTRSEVEYTVC